ncbi:MAG TPA: ATPase domain-containing protein [Thermoanaerobaculia bacterium]|jgi:circadian clock protein KaiC
MTPTIPTRDAEPTGIRGLDDVLNGGLTKDRVYLVQGDPGVGKTTLGVHFLLEGVRLGQRVLYITLSETRDEIEAVARSHGWDLTNIDIFEYSAGHSLEVDDESTLFHPSEVELGEATKTMLAEVDRVQPQRVVFDSLSEIRLLAQNPLRYRRQILGLKQYFGGRHCTVLLLDDRGVSGGDMQLLTLAHGVILLEQLAPIYGAERRRLRVSKLRGVKYRGGYHDFTIRTGGMVVFPRLIAAEHREDVHLQQLPSGIPAIDSLLGGGIDRGTSTLVMGPAGSGKSLLTTQYALSAAERGEHAALFVFDESRATLLARAAATSMDLSRHIESGLITVQQIDPAEIPPGEFVQLVRDAVEKRNLTVLVIDSLNGYLNAMPEEHFLTIQMHELLMYLGQKGVATLLVVAQHGVVGTSMNSPVDVSYLADSVILFRYFELAGELRKAVSVVKKRSGAHEKAIRPLTIGPEGLRVGPPLTEFHGVMSGTPVLDSNMASAGVASVGLGTAPHK